MSYLNYAYPKKLQGENSENRVYDNGTALQQFLEQKVDPYWIIDKGVDGLPAGFMQVRIVLRSLSFDRNGNFDLGNYKTIYREQFNTRQWIYKIIEQQQTGSVKGYLKSIYPLLNTGQLEVNFTQFVFSCYPTLQPGSIIPANGLSVNYPILTAVYIDAIVDFGDMNNVVFYRSGSSALPGALQNIRYQFRESNNSINHRHVNILLGAWNTNSPLFRSQVLITMGGKNTWASPNGFNWDGTDYAFAILNNAMDIIIYGVSQFGDINEEVWPETRNTLRVRYDSTTNSITDVGSSLINLSNPLVTIPPPVNFTVTFPHTPIRILNGNPPVTVFPAMDPSVTLGAGWGISVFRQLSIGTGRLNFVERLDLNFITPVKVNLNQSNFIGINLAQSVADTVYSAGRNLNNIQVAVNGVNYVVTARINIYN